jgi:hypothetical protein
MAILTTKFAEALGLIEPSEDDKTNAPLAHERVRTALKDAEALKDWGLHPVLIGSYARNVSIRRVKDVDVFCRMDDIDDTVTPSKVLDEFFKVLDAEFGTDSDGKKRVKRQARSLTVSFPEYEGLHVDAVPARLRANGYWEIPTKDGDWQQTNPEKLTELKTAMNKQYDEMYVRSVKLARQARRAILGDTRPGGLFAEMCLYEAFKNGEVKTDTYAHAFTTSLEAIYDYLDAKVGWGKSLPDPTMPGRTLTFRATDNQWETARDKFKDAAADARKAYVSTDEHQAATVYRRLLGKNGDDKHVFPEVPESSARAVTPGAHNVPAGNRRFG